jgi:hypothetical protein
LTKLLLDGFTISHKSNPTGDIIGVIYQKSGYYDYSNDVTIRNCKFESADVTTDLPALAGNGKLGGTLLIEGNLFESFFAKQFFDNTHKDNDNAFQKLTSVKFNKNTLTGVVGGVSIHGRTASG